MIAKLINIAPNFNEMNSKKEKRKELETEVGGQASFLPYPARLSLTQLRQVFI